MKYELLKQNIRSFRLLANSMIYSTTNNEILLNEEVIYQSNKGLQEIYFNGSNAYTNTIYGDGVEINLENKSVQFFENEFLKFINSNFKISSKDGKTLIHFDGDNSTTIKPFKIFIYSIVDAYNLLVYYDKLNNKINTIGLISDKLYSSFDLTSLSTWLDGAVDEPHQVTEFSGTYNNTLVCTMNSGAILLLDIERGEVKQFFKDAKVRGGIYQKEENSTMFLGLKHYTLIEINAESGQLLRQVDVQHELKRVANIPNKSPCWLSVGTSVYQNGLFYFYGDKNFLGIFDLSKEEIIDFHWFEFENKNTQLKGGIENLQVKGDEIYCLDTANTLHILKR